MKVSELIHALQMAKTVHGDIEVVRYDQFTGEAKTVKSIALQPVVVSIDENDVQHEIEPARLQLVE